MSAEHYDNSKIGDFLICPRMYYFNWGIKIEPDVDSIHLKFGSDIHSALEYLYTELKTGRKCNEELKLATLAQFRNAFTSDEVPYHKTKNLDSGLLILDLFLSNAGFWDFGSVLGMEMEVRAKGYAGKLDLVTEIEDTIYVIDHKTTSRLDADTFSKWRQDRALLGYNWLVRQLYPGRKRYVTIVNVLHIIKKPGIFRSSYEFSDFHINEWQRNTEEIIVRIKQAHIDSWPKYDTGCQDSKWGCNYQPLCDQANSLQDLIIPAGYREKGEWYV